MDKVKHELSAARQEELKGATPRDTFYDNPSVREARNMQIAAAPIDPEVYAQELVKADRMVNQTAESRNKKVTESSAVRTNMFNWIKNAANDLQENINRLQSGEMGVTDFGNMFSGTHILTDVTLLDGQVNTATSPRYSRFLLSDISWMYDSKYKIDEEMEEKQRIWKENLKRHGRFNFVPWWRSDGKNY